MKKILAVFLVVCFCASLTVSANGRIIGSYVNTDIIAYIDGMAINSYNIEGWTGVVAEDLSSYGFDVIWNGSERTLCVDNKENKPINGTFDVAVNKKPIGSYAGNIYATDIKTYVAGEEVKAFNIGGRTIIYIDELLRVGDVKWYEFERKICYSSVGPWSINLYDTDYEAVTENNINSFSLDMVKGDDGHYVTDGENLDYLDYLKLSYSPENGMCFSFSIYQRVLFQTEDLLTRLLEVCNENYDGTIISETTDLANKRLKILINGETVSVSKVTRGKGNGHTDFYFWLNCFDTKENIDSVAVVFE